MEKLVHLTALGDFVLSLVDANKITNETAKAACTLFNLLPANVKLPKIAPEGEGGLTVVWDDAENPVLLVVEEWKFHLVTSAATPRAQYFDDLPFDGEQIPRPVIEAIPTNL